MRCPKCKYEPTLSEMKINPGTCPSCGVIYERYSAAVKARAAGLEVTKGKVGVSASTPVGQVQEVVVTDIRMGFMSMVAFMVKWAFAAIPAVVIIAFFWVMIFKFMRLLLSL